MPICQETFVYLIMLRVFVFNNLYGDMVKTVDCGAGAGEKNRRVRHKNELGMPCLAV